MQRKTQQSNHVERRRNGERVKLEEIMKTPALFIARLVQDGLPFEKRHGKLNNETSIVYGIPTIQRNREDYLNDTLDSIFDNMSNVTGVVVFIADFDYSYYVRKVAEMRERYNDQLDRGQLELILGCGKSCMYKYDLHKKSRLAVVKNFFLRLTADMKRFW